MAGRQQHLDYLASIPTFASLGKKDLRTVARAAAEARVPAGKVLVDQGEMGREMFVVVEGHATVKRNGRKISTVGPGDVVGELSLLDRGPRTATVTADEDLTVLVLGSREFSALVDTVPGLARKLLAGLAGRIRELDRKIYG